MSIVLVAVLVMIMGAVRAGAEPRGAGAPDSANGASSFFYPDCVASVRIRQPTPNTIQVRGDESCGGVGVPENLTVQLERNGVVVPGSVVFVPDNPGGSSSMRAESTIPCVGGTYLGKVAATLMGDFGPDSDSAFTPPTTINCSSGVLADPPVITSFGCFSERRGRFECTVSFTGGVAPVSIRWTPGAGFWDDRTSVSGACAPGQNMTVTVRVISATGVEDADASTFPCRSGNP